MKQYRLYLILAGALIVFGLIFGAYRRGKAIGETDAKVHQLDSLTKQSDALRHADSLIALSAVKRADSAERVAKAAELASQRMSERLERAREKVVVAGDTVNGTLQPEVANLIRVSDSTHLQDAFTIDVQRITIEKKDSAILALNQEVADETQGLKLRDEEIGVLKRAKRPMFGFKTGLIVGALITGAVLFHAR